MMSLAAPPNSANDDVKPGDPIRVLEGPFQGLRGRIEAVDVARRRLAVSLNLFGRDTSVEVEFSHTEKL